MSSAEQVEELKEDFEQYREETRGMLIGIMALYVVLLVSIFFVGYQIRQQIANHSVNTAQRVYQRSARAIKSLSDNDEAQLRALGTIQTLIKGLSK